MARAALTSESWIISYHLKHAIIHYPLAFGHVIGVQPPPVLSSGTVEALRHRRTVMHSTTYLYYTLSFMGCK